ncbi:Adenylate cyclase type 6, partial [Paramuricea clavata]
MADDIKALRRATNGDEICRILARFGENLHDIVLCDQYIGQGLVEILRDLTGSTDIDVCSSALSLITRLVTDNHELIRKLCKPMGFLRKLMKLCSPFEDDGKHDKKSHLALHNQAVALIKTLVLSSECAMPEVASIDLIGQLIELCGIFFDDSRHTSCCYGNLGYPPRATSYFHDLAHGRKLIGNVREMFPEASMKVVEASEAKEIFEKDTNVCVLSVDLYDTRTDQDIVIREELVKENMAWPKFLSPEKEAKIFAKNKGREEQIWADITVTSVIDGGHFWAQVGGETVDEKLRNISLTLLKEDQAKFTTVPEVGELVCCKTMVGGHQDVYRGKILQVFRTQDEIVLELFAVDYGFKNVVPLNCVTRITALGRQEPFQARLCGLTGIQPPSSDVNVLVNTAAALRNLAYQSNASRLQILDKNGVDALLKLIVLPNKEIRKQVIGAILNLSINFKTRARIGFLGGIKILLDLINNDFKQEIELLCLAIGALRNLMLASPINRGRCADADGFLILTNMYFSSTSNDVKQQCLGALKNLVGNSWYLLTGSGGVDLRGVVDENRVRPFSLSAVITPSKLPPMQR